MIESSSYQGKYVQVWEKYRPVILTMMIGSSKEPQDYKLSNHEFKDLNNNRKSGYSFVLKVFGGRNENDFKKNPLAQDLLHVLKSSAKAKELTTQAIYMFELDRHFNLRVTCHPITN